MQTRPTHLYSLKDLLDPALQSGYAVGSFSPRCLPVITPILKAGQKLQSPIIVQVAQVELRRYDVQVSQFAESFRRQWSQVRPDVPVCLHLDHTKSFDLIKEAIASGFTSVMIDASEKPLEENIATTCEVVEYAHAQGVSVEAELGRIGSADQIETTTDEELFTIPEEARQFVDETGVDALAISVGTAHGVYTTRQPRIDLATLAAIRAETPVHLVLHGGSGTPRELIHQAVQLPGGGISKINYATDLELALLSALGLPGRITNDQLMQIPQPDLQKGLAAVQAVVEEKILDFLGSQGRAPDYLAG